MVTFFARTGVIAAAVAGGIAIIGAGIALAITGAKKPILLVVRAAGRTF